MRTIETLDAATTILSTQYSMGRGDYRINILSRAHATHRLVSTVSSARYYSTNGNSISRRTPPQPQLATTSSFRGAEPLKGLHREYQYRLETSVVVTSLGSIPSLSHIAPPWAISFGYVILQSLHRCLSECRRTFSLRIFHKT